MAAATEHLKESGILHTTTVLHLFDKIIASDCIIKNQQNGDPELTGQEKREILFRLMEDSPSAFLTRFGSILNEKELDYFHKIGDHEIQYHVEVLRREVKRSKHRKNNRRLKAVSELTANSDYFSEEAMQERNPLLYEQTIGQYLSEDEVEQRLADSSKRSDCTLSSLILTNMSRKMVTDKLKRQIEAEECQIEEEEDEDEEVEEEEKEFTSSYSISSDPHLAEVEKKMLKHEFLVAMQQSFLRGEDADFDYTSVDQNESYDDFSAMAQDDEDSYFDSEEPSECTQSENRETSVEAESNCFSELMDTERVNR